MGEAESPLTRYIKDILSAQKDMNLEDRSVHGYVLHRGRLFTSQTLTPEEQEYIDRCSWRSHEVKQCYYNAQLTALTMPEQEVMTLLYAEGFLGMRSKYGINHAWLSLNGKVVDTTLRISRRISREPGEDDRRPMGIIPQDLEYYGVELHPSECLHSIKHRAAEPLIDDWKCGWPLISRENRQKKHR